MLKGRDKKREKQNWLHKKYILLLRNEESLREQSPLRGTGWQLLLVVGLMGLAISLLSVFCSITLYTYWQDNHSSEAKLRKQVVELSYLTDSLSTSFRLYQHYARSMSAVFRGDESYLREPTTYSATTDSSQSSVPAILSSSLPSLQIRTEDVSSSYRSYNLIRDAHFFPPIRGYVSDHYSLEKAHYGVDLLAPQGTSVQATATGIVILASWTKGGGYVIALQHNKGLISIYKHNEFILKKVGDQVQGGEAIAIIGNTGELSTGPHLHFEIWHNGRSLDPGQFIDFR